MEIDSYGQINKTDNKILVNKGVYEYSFKKTEKIVTALYMVTDYSGVDDAIGSRIRSVSIELMSYINKLLRPYSDPLQNRNYISNIIADIEEIKSLLGIANTLGFISDMNTKILDSELSKLAGDIKENQSNDNRFSFAIDQGMFDLPKPQVAPFIDTQGVIKDKRTDYNMSFTNQNSIKNMSLIKRTLEKKELFANKEDRAEKILNFIKDKKDLSIKDISIAFTDCSEKTIQRELNSLVQEGKIVKSGSKRWSRYSSI